MGKSGAGNYMISFLYEEEMSLLLDFRPIAVGEVLDSAPISDSNDTSSE